ncbi:cysteine protease StiP family protein [Actinoplanes sp. URMC 104]|uniref:cysteine protease StiP family protein n=1 Tax=Actinoplanes sp. URMC 104 TaxID=3423409 RepID=UPI003F1E088F
MSIAPLRGPTFGSYRRDEVAWLLTDLSGVRLEAPAEQREQAIQAGRAHYAESLPIEYQPTDEYVALFHRALDNSAARLAHDVGVLAELIRDRVSTRPVLLSLARAGTPIGILLRRWFRHVHGLDRPHYAVSIVRGRGIDAAALRWVADRHDPADVVFVDGWTGKGAIALELAGALEELRRRDRLDVPGPLAVLADPGSCTSLHGSRDDYLVPSACLNSTVSGLVSRTVCNPALLAAKDFHGAKFYADLAGADVSGLFLDSVSRWFDSVSPAIARDWPRLAASNRTPTWSGWEAVQRIGREYGIRDTNLIKPGVGETTRVLLRRVPWRVLIRPDAGSDAEHILLLAAQRGVPVEEVPGLPYLCVGLIRELTG